MQGAGKEAGEDVGELKRMTAAAAEPVVWEQKEAEPMGPVVAMLTASLQTLVAVFPHHLCPSLQSPFYSCSVKH